METLREVQRVFDVAYYVLCDEDTAWDVVCEAYDQREDLMKDQNQRGTPNKPYNLRRLCPEHHLQDALYRELDRLDKKERAQEQRTPVLSPEEQLIRYLKYLVWRTSEKNAEYVAVGLGHFLYSYSLQDIEALHPRWPRQHYLERAQKRILGWICERFEDAGIINTQEDGTQEVQMRSPTEDERQVIRTALEMFTPWWPPCDPHVTQPRTYGEQLLYVSNKIFRHFGDQELESSETVWTQIHFLVHPCVGVETLMQANEAWAKRAPWELKTMHEPESKLRVPAFPPAVNTAGTSPPSNLSTSPPRTAPKLTCHRLAFLEGFLEGRRRRRQHYRVGTGTLLVQVDGQASSLWEPTQPFDVALPLTAAYVEIYGQDAEGLLRLAVLPIPPLDEEMEPLSQRLMLEGEQTVAFALTVRCDAATGDVVGSALRLTYEEPVPQPVLTSVGVAGSPTLRDRLVSWLSPCWSYPFRPAPAADTAAREHTFHSRDGEITITCKPWSTGPDRPSMLWIAWEADFDFSEDLWVRFTRPREPEALLAEVRLGHSVEGERLFRSDQLGFDPVSEPCDLAILLKERHV
jgi:hypothetical protein